MILLALVGCPAQRPLCVTAAARQAAAVQVDVGQGRSCDQTPLVQRVEVRRGPEETTIWALYAATALPLRSVTYGTVPDGFEQPLPPAELTPGDRLVFEVKGPVDQGGLELVVEP